MISSLVWSAQRLLIPETTHQISGDGESVAENLGSWPDLEVLPDRFVEGVQRSLGPEQLGRICKVRSASPASTMT